MTQAKDSIHIIGQGEFIKCYSEGECEHHGEKQDVSVKECCRIRFWLGDLEEMLQKWRVALDWMLSESEGNAIIQ